MPKTRRKDVDWDLPTQDGAFTWTHAQMAVLMDIRDELKNLNGYIGCHNCIAIPSKLDHIARATGRIAARVAPTKPSKKKA